MNQWPWSVLQIESTADERAVRRAYARVLKQSRADEDPIAFQQLRRAYEHALLGAQNVPGSLPHALFEVSNEVSPPAVGSERELPQDAVSITASIEKPDAPSPQPRQWADVPEIRSAADEAAELWSTFIADSEKTWSRHALTNLFTSVINFEVRDELEWQALLHCMRDATPLERRVDIADVLKWKENSTHLRRRDAVMAARGLAEVFA